MFFAGSLFAQKGAIQTQEVLIQAVDGRTMHSLLYNKDGKAVLWDQTGSGVAVVEIPRPPGLTPLRPRPRVRAMPFHPVPARPKFGT